MKDAKVQYNINHSVASIRHRWYLNTFPSASAFPYPFYTQRSIRVIVQMNVAERGRQESR